MRFSKWHALGNSYLVVERSDAGALTSERARRLFIGEADDIDGDDGLAQPRSELSEHVIDHPRLNCSSNDVPARVGNALYLVGLSHNRGRPALACRSDPCVAKHPEQIADVVIGMQDPRLSQNARECLLDQVLGLLARAAQAPRRSVQPIDVVTERLGIEVTSHAIASSG